jgi:hypothetical protein
MTMSRKAFELFALGKTLKLAAVPLVLASLSACATGLDTSVSRFQSQMPPPQGQTFAVVADNPALAGGMPASSRRRWRGSAIRRPTRPMPR